MLVGKSRFFFGNRFDPTRLAASELHARLCERFRFDFTRELPEIALLLVTIHALPIHFVAGELQLFQTEDIFANNRRGHLERMP